MNRISQASLTDAASTGPALEVDRDFFSNIANSLEPRTLVTPWKSPPLRSGNA